jgi:carboxylesterase type B
MDPRGSFTSGPGANVEYDGTAFARDPHPVTLAGESAGAMAVAALMAVPAACGMFTWGRSAERRASAHSELPAGEPLR